MITGNRWGRELTFIRSIVPCRRLSTSNLLQAYAVPLRSDMHGMPLLSVLQGDPPDLDAALARELLSEEILRPN